MALARKGNTVFTTSPDVLTGTYILIGVIFLGTAANGSAIISDSTSSSPSSDEIKFEIGAGNQDTMYLDLSRTPIRFESGISVGTITNGALTLIIRDLA